jgi:hypothetical protein
LDFGASLERIRDERLKSANVGELPLLKKVQPVHVKTERDSMPCADEQCNSTSFGVRGSGGSVLLLSLMLVQRMI